MENTGGRREEIAYPVEGQCDLGIVVRGLVQAGEITVDEPNR